MKKLLLAIAITIASSSAFAYSIGGEYAQLVSCNYGRYGYQYGNIGTYKTMSGSLYQVFFGAGYCSY